MWQRARVRSHNKCIPFGLPEKVGLWSFYPEFGEFHLSAIRVCLEVISKHSLLLLWLLMGWFGVSSKTVLDDWTSVNGRMLHSNLLLSSPSRSAIQWTWTWANSGRWWGTGKSAVLQSMGSQRVGHDLVTKQPPPPSRSFWNKHNSEHSCTMSSDGIRQWQGKQALEWVARSKFWLPHFPVGQLRQFTYPASASVSWSVSHSTYMLQSCLQIKSTNINRLLTTGSGRYKCWLPCNLGLICNR